VEYRMRLKREYGKRNYISECYDIIKNKRWDGSEGGFIMTYKEYLKKLIGRRGTLDMPEHDSYYTLRFNEENIRLRNAYLIEVQDDFVVINHDIHGMIKIPLSSFR
jgi:hypothetical protein